MSFERLIIDLVILAIFGAAVYSFLILPRRREFRKRQQFVSELEIGTQVTTYGGMLGRVTDIDRETNIVTLEIAQGVEVKMMGPAIMGEFDPVAVADSVRRALGERGGE